MRSLLRPGWTAALLLGAALAPGCRARELAARPWRPAAEPAPSELVRVERTAPAMGTTFRVVVYAPDEARGDAAARAAFARIAQLDALLTDWDPDSPTRRLAGTTGVPQQVPEDLFRVLEISARAVALTAGAFDPTVGPLTKLWRRALRQGELPDAAALERARAAVGWEHVTLDAERRTVALAVPGMALDFGGIGKGYALDAALETLRQLGCERALVDGGGDVALGAPPPGASGWEVAVRPFGGHGSHVVQRLVLRDTAVATSGDRYQWAIIDGVRYSHLVDPRSASALTSGLSATVIGAGAALSDALASGLCVTGSAGLAPLEELEGFTGWVGTPELWPGLHWGDSAQVELPLR